MFLTGHSSVCIYIFEMSSICGDIVLFQADWLTDRRPPSGWPDTGALDFNNYSTRYRPGLDLVLKNVTAKIHPGEKVPVQSVIMSIQTDFSKRF